MTKINLVVGAKPEFEWVDIDLIDVDHNYQREIDGKRVERILGDFRWDRFGALNLVRKPDGRYACADGQHRWKAAQLHPNISEVPALVTQSDGIAGEAEIFLAVNRGRKIVTPVETFWAGVAAGDPESIRLKEVLAKADCAVVSGNGNYKPGHTNAVGAMAKCLMNYGDAATVTALKIARAAWPTDPQSLRGSLINALARIVRNNPTADMGRLSKVLAPKSIADLTASAEGFRKLSGGSTETVLSKTIAELYNKGLSTNLIHFGAAA